MAITAGATFVSRGYSGELKHLAWLIGQALDHPGYALVDVLQPCVSFNRGYAYDFYGPRVYKLEEEEGYDPADKAAAWQRALEWGDRIPIGIFYRTEIPTYEDQVPALRAGPLVKQPMETLQPQQITALQAEIM
jgi:2-oxoglutarate ferredoxin oxidoreductase subunit beta